MAELPFLLSFPRLLRHLPHVGADLPPDEAVTLDAPDAPLREALVAVGKGDFTVARDLLASTRRGARWERRDRYVSELADHALHRPGWLDAWLAEDPDDPDAWLVRADLAIGRAWEIRTAARARHVSREQFQAFHTLLRDAVPTVERAVELNPEDPVPWRVAINHAMGSQAPREIFDGYLMEVMDRDPGHYGCHASALQYLCAKWYGSHQEMFEFAESAADRAEPGALLNALPIQAVTEYVLQGDEEDEIPEERVTAAVERTLELSAHYEPGDPVAAGFRNHLALALIRAGRLEDALETFRAIGVHARAHPWKYENSDALAEFLEMRQGVRVLIARRTPFFAKPAPRPEPAGTGPADAGAPWRPRAVAVCSAPPRAVEEAALMTGLDLRLAPAPGARTFVELAVSAATGPRGGVSGALLGEGSLTEAASTITRAEKWPALVLHRTGDRYGITLLRDGKKVVSHEWDLAAPVPDFARASDVAKALADAYGVRDIRPLTALLRTDGAGADHLTAHLTEVCAALGLPPLPEGFGERTEILDGARGSKLVRRRSFFAAIKETLSSDGDRDKGNPTLSL
ncbi:hypothetical protein [Streptomyces megasporus]|uniref:hypothetical protein n=1 Tax=Streptomyces megasporus TaxID=44060 RepID=UPI000B1D7DCD|nr:hypothetical protein [Streptomyces megasporus]